MLFCPTDPAVENLIREEIDQSKIFRSGDVMCDMLRLVESKLQPKFKEKYFFSTVHRPYNTDDPERLEKIFLNFGKPSV